MTAAKADIVGRHADSVVDAFPSHDLKTLAAELESDVDPYEAGWERTIAIAIAAPLAGSDRRQKMAGRLVTARAGDTLAPSFAIKLHRLLADPA